MICPACGGSAEKDFAECSCGARVVGLPQTDTIALVPRLGPAMLGLAFAVGGFACYFSKFFLVFSFAGAWLSVRAWKFVRSTPLEFGGRKMAATGAVLSLGMIAVIAVLVGYQAPRWLEARHVKKQAATRARMLEISLALDAYREKHGTLPPQLSELRREGFLSSPVRDAWDGVLGYGPTGELASASVGKGAAPVFTEYRLVSPGGDGVAGTRDDIVLTNHLFVSPSSARSASIR